MAQAAFRGLVRGSTGVLLVPHSKSNIRSSSSHDNNNNTENHFKTPRTTPLEGFKLVMTGIR